jgi:hypothetical protein
MTVRTSTLQSHLPKLDYLRQRIQDTVQLSLEKAAAHLTNKTKYPLPAGKESLEYAITDLMKLLPKRKQDKFLDKMKEALNATPSAREQKYGALSSIDFCKATAIVDLVQALPVPDEMRITEKDLAIIKKRFKKPVVTSAGSKSTGRPRQAIQGTVLQFAVENITCVETNDRRKDEVTFSAFVVDSTGAQQDRSNFFSADFKKGDTKSPGAAGNLFSINLGDSTGGVFPASFAGGVLITEEGIFDGGDKTKRNGAILRVVGKVIATAGIPISFIPGVGLPLTLTVIGIGTIIIALGDVMLFGGDINSQIIPDELLLESPPFAGETFVRTVELGFLDDGFIQKGKYSVALRWTVA